MGNKWYELPWQRTREDQQETKQATAFSTGATTTETSEDVTMKAQDVSLERGKVSHSITGKICLDKLLCRPDMDKKKRL